MNVLRSEQMPVTNAWIMGLIKESVHILVRLSLIIP